jgi:hypothetical protein
MRLRRYAAFLLVLLACAPAWGGADCERVFAVGDLHGGYDAFVGILRETGLVDEQTRWSGERDCLVQLGDIVDRGARSRDILDLLMSLQKEAPGRVHVLLGNHEVMDLVGDLRYVIVEEFAAFADEETAEEREAGLAAYQELVSGNGNQGAQEKLREEFDEKFPPGWFAHRRAFSLDGRYGSWLIKRPIIVEINRSVFVHGGLTLENARLGIEAINEQVAFELVDYFTCRKKLEDVGWLKPLTPYAETFREVYRQRQETNANAGVSAANGVADQYLRHLQSHCIDERGPVWYRGLAREEETSHWPTVLRTLRELGADRIVVAHTPTKTHRIQTRFGGRVYVVDTGTGPAYGGRASALEIQKNGTVYAVYSDAREKLADPILSDADIAQALREGTILEMEEIGSGISKPKKITLEWRGRRFEAAFKTIDIERLEKTSFESSGMQHMFTDSYRYDLAAYQLDRQLGMYMVPVVTLRKINDEQGAMMEWVGDAMSEAQRLEEGLKPPDPLILMRQLDTMKIFDALILNEDRHPGNQLIGKDDWQLHLIDHTRSFRLTKKLPDGFEENPITIPRHLYAALQDLGKKSLQDLFGSLISSARIKALLVRRDKIVKKIEKDIEQYGPAMVFQDAQNKSNESPE